MENKIWHQITLLQETGYHNFPQVANRTRSGRILDKPICYYDKEENALRSQIREAIRAIWDSKEPLVGDIEAVYFFGVKIPESWSNKKRAAALSGKIKPRVKPDLTNRLYWLENRLKGIVFGDDALIVDLSARGRYVEKPYAQVFVRIVPDSDD